ncbi:MAG: SCO family protein [Gemmatimonadetes bacterium]|nr:SCO family protein [Gemmatimonadota bacterium]
MTRAGRWGATVVVAAVALWALVARPWAPTLPVLPIGGEFALTDHNGAPFRLSQLQGKVVLVFFGYSMCPDVCPTTLSKLSVVARRLGDDAAKVKTLYVTVDPDRDTPSVLKADLQSFALDAIGLTGPRPAVDSVVKKFGASYSLNPTPESVAKYTVTHTTTLYALDVRGRARMTFAYEASVEEIVNGIRRILAADGP